MALVIWGVIFVSLGIYVWVIYALRHELPLIETDPSTLGTTRLFMMIEAAFVLVLTPSVYRKLLARAYRPGSARDAEPDDLDGIVRSTYAFALIVAMALYESIAVQGLMLAFMGAGKNTIIGFFGVCAVAMLTARPKTEHLQEHYAKAQRAVHDTDG